MKPEVEVLAGPDEVVARAAALVEEGARRARAEGRRFRLVVSGGATPLPLYRLLAAPPWRDRLPWESFEVFWADERCVPPDSPRSNHRAVREALLDRVPVPAAQVHRIEAERPDAAPRYEAAIRSATGAAAPAFDLVLLGLGADGHTASLFPGSPEPEAGRLAAPATGPDGARVTLTARALSAGQLIAFLVTGAEKRDAVRRALHGPTAPAGNPAQRLFGGPARVLWLLDPAAAG